MEILPQCGRGAQRGEQVVEQRHHGEHRGLVRDPGDVEGDRVPTSGRAQPEVVRRDRPDLRDLQDARHAVAHPRDGVQAGDEVLAGEEPLRLQLLRAAGGELEPSRAPARGPRPRGSGAVAGAVRPGRAGAPTEMWGSEPRFTSAHPRA